MKRILLYSVVVWLVCGITGCKNDPTTPDGPVSATLVADADDSYSYVSGAKLHARWEQDDQLGVFGALTVNSQFRLSGLPGGPTGRFTGEIQSGATVLYAYYPYDPLMKMEGDELSVRLPEEQTYDPTRIVGNPMAGVTASDRIDLKNICGLLGVNVVAGENIEVFTITLKARKAAGEGIVTIGNQVGDNPELVMSESAVDRVKLHVSDAGFPIALGKSAMFYISLPPQTYDDMEVTVEAGGNRAEVLTIDTPLTIERSKITTGVNVFFEESKPVTGIDLNDPVRYDIADVQEVYSNSYLVEEAGNYFLKATVIGNGPGGFHPDGGFHTRSATIAPRSAALLWQDVDGAVTNVKLSPGGTYLTFDAVTVPANAVVAVYDDEDAAGNILWSWHIWLSEKPRDHQYKTPAGQNTYLVMDRNLGAAYAPPTDVQADMEAMTDAQRYASYGLIYQWGRKDPFWGCSAVSGLKDKVVFGAVTTISTVAYNATGDQANNNLLYAVQHPVTVIKYNPSLLNWNYTTAGNLWGNPTGYKNYPKGQKTIYDPCPVGYMVSPADLWAATGFDQSIIGKFKRGRMFRYDGTNIAWYPSAGLRWEDDGKVGDVGSAGYYWSNSMFDDSGKGALEYLFFTANADVFMINQYASASGHSIRCVRE